MSTSLNHPIKWHGGKHYLAGKFWDIAQPILSDVAHCVETHCGGCAWTLEGLARGYEKSFVVNDLDGDLTNFWEVLQSDHLFARFLRTIEATPFSEDEWRISSCFKGNPPEIRARDFFVRCRQSLAGRMQSFAPLSKTRTRRGMNEQVSAWLSAVEGLPEAHEMLKRVVILNRDALLVIRQQDGPQTLFYMDPPYLHDTRKTKNEYGRFEMTEQDHIRLLNLILDCQGKVMLSGYPSQLYEEKLQTWTRHTFDLPNNAASGKTKGRETEVLWCNF